MTDAAPKLSDLILEQMGIDAVVPQSKIGRMLREGGPSKTSEFRRIHNLPRRDWAAAPDLDRLVELLSKHLATPTGEMMLWPVQAAALREAHDVGGLFGPIAVGKGKAIISLLAGVVMNAERPLLLVPASLREQTNLSVLPEMSKHWRLPANLRIVGYTEVSLEKNADLIQEINPDLIIADEVHRLKNKNAGRTKRVARHMKEHPETRFVALSGTITNQSIKEYAHILRWCLKDKAPLPESWRELSLWADVLDDVDGDVERPPAGALSLWAKPDQTVRQGYRDRLVQTPGVIATAETELGVSLQILARRPRMPTHVRKMLATMVDVWETPNGDIITEAVDLWRHVRELCCGFYYRWDPPPPRWWLDPRREWGRYVRDTLRYNKRELDTELQVWNECADKHGRPRKPKAPDLEDVDEAKAKELERKHEAALAFYEAAFEDWRAELDPNHCMWCAWVDVKKKFEPNTVAEWVDPFVLDDATEWLKSVGGIVWTDHVVFGEKLAEVSGVPYFGAGKKANVGIATHRGPCIASIRAHSEGKNLQHHKDNLIIVPPTSGKTWEQVLGRTHRAGQQADEVTAWVNLHDEALVDAFRKALRRAKYLEHTLGSRQKLLYADIGFRDHL